MYAQSDRLYRHIDTDTPGRRDMVGGICIYMPINVEKQRNIFTEFCFSVLIVSYIYCKIDMWISIKIFLQFYRKGA